MFVKTRESNLCHFQVRARRIHDAEPIRTSLQWSYIMVSILSDVFNAPVFVPAIQRSYRNVPQKGYTSPGSNSLLPSSRSIHAPTPVTVPNNVSDCFLLFSIWPGQSGNMQKEIRPRDGAKNLLESHTDCWEKLLASKMVPIKETWRISMWERR